MSTKVKGVYAHLDCLMTGIDRLQKAGFDDLGVALPLPRHEVEAALFKGRPSPVRWWTLLGGATGACLGFTIASLTGVDWPMAVVGGKPIVGVPPYVIITFESMVLLGGLVTLAGMFYHCRLPGNDTDEELCDARFSDDHFGIVVRGAGGEKGTEAAQILQGSGAIEVSGASPGTPPVTQTAAPVSTPVAEPTPSPELPTPAEQDSDPVGALSGSAVLPAAPVAAPPEQDPEPSSESTAPGDEGFGAVTTDPSLSDLDATEDSLAAEDTFPSLEEE